MLYLESFRLASADQEVGFLLSFPHQLEMRCYDHNNVYPFKLFPEKGLEELTFAPVTLLYGGNGSGKSTVLNLIAEALGLDRASPFNHTPFSEPYLKLCKYTLAPGVRRLPTSSRMISSDDVFDLLLDTRSINQGIDRRREALFEEYYVTRETPMEPLRDLAAFEEFKRRNEAKRSTKSAYVSRRMPRAELLGRSNGESAFSYFTQKITENALYLLDEPENSLSAALQMELARFLEDSARFYGCQFILSTHSPFLLSLKGARIYDLDTTPVQVRPWTDLENVRAYYELFARHGKEFETKPKE
ncbi:MAG: AAA family ATPase [Clostridia bacterium]|nr:AAA family ATPase [Clostridia bacterium]